MVCEVPDTARTSLAPRSTERHVSDAQEADLVASEMRVKGRHLEDGSTIHSLAYKSA